MSKKFLFTNASGFYEETPGAYEESDFINVSAGAADAGKPIVLDADGNIDASMINDADIDHGNLTGLGDDDHTQYILVAGTRAFTGDQSMGGFNLTSVGDPTSATIDAASDDALPTSFLASTANGEGASIVGVEDSAGYFSSDNVEGVLAELYALAALGGPFYTVGTGGVTKGDLLYISGNDTVNTASLSTNAWSVGLAATTQSAAATVQVLANDGVLTGVLTGATAGQTQYWNGTAITSTQPAGGGNYVWKVGVAKNATDLHVEVEFIKKNA